MLQRNGSVKMTGENPAKKRGTLWIKRAAEDRKQQKMEKVIHNSRERYQIFLSGTKCRIELWIT